MDDILWSIDPKNDSIEKTLDRMQEFAEGLKNSSGCKILMEVEEEVKSLNLDMKTRHEIYFIFKEALHIIVQHSNCTSPIINIDLIKLALFIKIHDNGPAFELKSLHNSPGIVAMEKRARNINAMLDIHADKKGTSIILQVPVG
jgi:signal transduction histidine kinase